MPSGRDIHLTKLLTAPTLEGHILTQMRSPPDGEEMDTDDDSGSDEADKAQSGLPGTFPGPSSIASNDNSYY